MQRYIAVTLVDYPKLAKTLSVHLGLSDGRFKIYPAPADPENATVQRTVVEIHDKHHDHTTFMEKLGFTNILK